MVCLVVISLNKTILLKAIIWQFSGVVFCCVAQVGCTFAPPLLQPAEKMTRKVTIAAIILKFLNKESKSSKDELFPQAAVLGRSSYDAPRPKRRWPAPDKVGLLLLLVLILRKKIFEWGQNGEVEDYVYGLEFSEKRSALRVVQGMADITETDKILLSTQSGKYKT